MSVPVTSQGYLLYEGPSLFDPSETILAIATGFKTPSTNVKTGEMIQIYIIRKDYRPTDVFKFKQDTSICGDCKHSAKFGRSCYVNLVYVNNVWRTYQAGKYPNLPDHLVPVFDDRAVRFGAYGDPAAVPMDIWEPILTRLRITKGTWTSYTHAWKYCDPEYKEFCVASVDTLPELREAQSQGWRTFRTLLEDEPITKEEFMCPASDTHFEKTGRKLTCKDCHACDGVNTRPNRGSAAIVVHGTKPKKNNYTNLRIMINNQEQ